MDANLKQKWVDALRSGQYVQGYGRLRRDMQIDSTYCCLGVLCEVAELPRTGGGYIAINGKGAPYVVVSLLPMALSYATGYVDREPLPFRDREGNVLGFTAINDSREFTFAQIADLIEHFIPAEEDSTDAQP